MNMDPFDLPPKLYQELVLGAGVILRRNDSIAGLTTAAMIGAHLVLVLLLEPDSISKQFSGCVSL